ncbi:hypothetical protein PY365_29340 [Roseiarcaceae bacterium H3SJ34-1]|uniref:hypothetical protein n=1 Tax=Terripilifer ovatus TaxID=3032367 RepID=UPI003AB96315|nr:hypothetical protein [Roseiarcaceae bacterium H3SJ34-1]
MHYSSGNYEAFVRPRKPEGADRKSAWFVGSGLAGLAAAGIEIPGPAFVRKLLMKKLESTEIAELLEEFHLISE